MKYHIANNLREWLLSFGYSNTVTFMINSLIMITALVLICVIVNYVTKRIIASLIGQVVKRSDNKWDDILLENKVFHRLSHFAPAVIIYYFSDVVLFHFPNYVHALKLGVYIYMLIAGLVVVNAFLNSVNQIYNTLEIAKNQSIKSYIQVIKIIIYMFVGIMILSIALDKSPIYFLTGMGAMAAVLLLIFKDSILGLVAGVQLASNDMVRPGDWIAMPSKGADGIVTEISLNTVKIQNWDKTITTIPTYSLVTEAFNNWRGMEESGGRRIKRSVFIDMKSVKFLDAAMIEKLRNVKVLSEYMNQKIEEIQAYNKENHVDVLEPINGRKLTNLGTFRIYVQEYLKNNPNINQEMTLIVRHLQPGETGIPLEIYAFSKIKEWNEYEIIQADIFDHLLAVIHEFELRVYQNPTGYDFQGFLEKN
jgi:miniconductance mechanosensitive channel